MSFTKRRAMYCLSLIITKWANYSTKNTCHTNEQFLQFRKKYSDIEYNAHCRLHDFLDFYLKTRETFKRFSLKQKWKNSFKGRHGIYLWHQQNQWRLFHHKYLFANSRSFAFRGISSGVMLLSVDSSQWKKVLVSWDWLIQTHLRARSCLPGQNLVMSSAEETCGWMISRALSASSDSEGNWGPEVPHRGDIALAGSALQCLLYVVL